MPAQPQPILLGSRRKVFEVDGVYEVFEADAVTGRLMRLSDLLIGTSSTIEAIVM